MTLQFDMVAVTGSWGGEADTMLGLDCKSYICSFFPVGQMIFPIYAGSVTSQVLCSVISFGGLLINLSGYRRWAIKVVKEHEIIEWENIRSPLSQRKAHSD